MQNGWSLEEADVIGTNWTRRTVLQTGAMATVALGARKLWARPLGLPAGVQLYSVRDLLTKDFEGTLAKVRQAGYAEVEAAGYYGRTAPEFKAAVERAGLKCTSVHHGMFELKDKAGELIEYAHALGAEYFVCPSPVTRSGAWGTLTLDDWRWVATELNKLGEKVRAAGMTFGYHNHGPEFGTENGVVFYDELLRLTDPKLVVFEMDCGWVAVAGRNPVDYLARSPERFPLLHIKDMTRAADGKFHSLIMGQGSIDYRPILRAATGLKHYYIEQEDFQSDAIDSIRQDAEYMRKLEL
jgi:sugar phosphate isomerase/epimerase